MAESKASLAFVRDFLTQGTLPPLPRETPWDAAAAIALAAREQGVAGLLHRAISEGETAALWPAEIRDALARDRRTALARGVRQLDLAGRVLGRLHRAGLRALPLKGAALLETLYDSEDARTMADVDVLALDDWPQARRLLEEDGFVECARADHAAVLREPATGAVLELHHGVTSSPGLFPLDRDGLWSRSVPGAGQVPRLPSAEDLLIQLSLHAAFQHGLVLSLAQWLDFRRLFERRSLDRERLLAALEEVGDEDDDRARRRANELAAVGDVERLPTLPALWSARGVSTGRLAWITIATFMFPGFGQGLVSWRWMALWVSLSVSSHTLQLDQPIGRSDAQGRFQAIALDPTLTAAAELIGRLMLEPPKRMPAQVVDELAEQDRAAGKRFVWSLVVVHGVSFASRHCAQCSGGQWLRREVSLATGLRSTMTGVMRRRTCRVASLIISTNSGLSATAGSLAKGLRKGPLCTRRLNEPFQERLAI